MYLSKNKERKLVELYPNTDDIDIAKILGISIWLIKNKASELSLEKNLKSNAWSEEEISHIIQYYSHCGNSRLSEELGKSKMEIEHYAFRLGLSKDADFYSFLSISPEEKKLVDNWSNEYSKELGSSRGNFVLERILYYIFPFSQIKPEYPVGSLRLDFYLPTLGLGFEFQGIQHKEHNHHFYESERDFLKAQERDYKKSELCEQMNIPIVYLYHDEKLSIPLVKAKIDDLFDLDTYI
jgi:hypothetical protein